jgi:hypothetical protein
MYIYIHFWCVEESLIILAGILEELIVFKRSVPRFQLPVIDMWATWYQSTLSRHITFDTISIVYFYLNMSQILPSFRVNFFYIYPFCYIPAVCSTNWILLRITFTTILRNYNVKRSDVEWWVNKTCTVFRNKKMQTAILQEVFLDYKMLFTKAAGDRNTSRRGSKAIVWRMNVH